MWQALQINRTLLRRGALAVLLLCILWAQHGLASQPGSLSRWLSREAMPELVELLSQHPRYARQQVLIAPVDNALEKALVTMLRTRLGKEERIALLDAASGFPALPLNDSIDAINCQVEPRGDYLLRVATISASEGRDAVRLELQELGGAGDVVRSWQWSGSFNGAERRSAHKRSGIRPADGSLDSPWSDTEVDAAARALSWQFACALRPQLTSRLALHWPAQGDLPDLFSDTANASRHMLGAYREIGISSEQSGFTVELRLQRFRHDTWQLWLIGTPARPDLAPIQAVTYFQHAGLQWPQLPVVVAGAPAPLMPRAAIEGEALDFIDVQLLDATQADHAGSRADLQVTLRIANSSDWPIAYSFTLSGGHFNHCIASPAYYRHDNYGRLTGSLGSGVSEVRRIIIENARHRPAPLFGVRKCAGFRDLDGFEAFASQGHKVTDFVRWDM